MVWPVRLRLYKGMTLFSAPVISVMVLTVHVHAVWTVGRIEVIHTQIHKHTAIIMYRGGGGGGGRTSILIMFRKGVKTTTNCVWVRATSLWSQNAR